jgi:putative MATE family efflux protein
MTYHPEKFEEDPYVEEPAGPSGLNLNEDAVDRTLVVLALPAMLEHLMHTAVHFSDTLIVGWLEDEVKLAAALLGGVITFLSFAPFFALNIATVSLVSRAWGARRYDRAARFAGQCLGLGILASLVVFLGGQLLAEKLMTWIGAEADVVPLGARFLRILLLSILFGSPMWIANAAIRGTGDTRTPMFIAMIMNVVNISVSIVLAFGIGPLPAFGLMGVAWGTVIARTLGGSLAVGALWLKRVGLEFSFPLLWRWKREEIREIVVLAFPTLCERLVWNTSFGVFTAIVAMLGTTTLAAHNIALHVESLAFMPANGAAHAVAAFVGQAVGAGRPRIAEMAVHRAIWYACLVMGTLGASFVIFGPQIAMIFRATPEVVALAGIALQISAIEHPLMALGLILAGSLQGAGDTRSPLYVMLVCILLFRFGAVYFFAITLGWGLPGVWLATALDWGGRSIGLYLIFRWGRWKTLNPS